MKSNKEKTISIRIRLNDSEIRLLKQLLGKCCPDKDLSNFHNERRAIHTLSIKLDKAFKELKP